MNEGNGLKDKLHSGDINKQQRKRGLGIGKYVLIPVLIGGSAFVGYRAIERGGGAKRPGISRTDKKAAEDSARVLANAIDFVAGESDRSVFLSSPEGALETFYRNCIKRDADAFLKTVSSDGEFSDADRIRKMFAGSRNWGFSNLKKISFVKKGIYRNCEAIASMEYYPVEMWKGLRGSCANTCFENAQGGLIAPPDPWGPIENIENTGTWAVLPSIYVFKKEDGEWKVHRNYGNCLGPSSYSPGDRRFIIKLKNEMALNYSIAP
jgi:hypothetical protein